MKKFIRIIAVGFMRSVAVVLLNGMFFGDSKVDFQSLQTAPLGDWAVFIMIFLLLFIVLGFEGDD